MRILALAALLACLPITLAADVTDADIEEALKTWRRYEMPQPPKDAPLVLLESGATHYEDGVPQPKRFRLVYKLAVAPGSRERSYFMGTSVETSEFIFPEVDKGKIEDLSGDMVEYGSYHPHCECFQTSNSFAMGLHVWTQGHKRLGREVAEQALKGDLGAMFCPFAIRKCKSVAELLPQVIWAHWLNQLIRPDSDRKVSLTA